MSKVLLASRRNRTRLIAQAEEETNKDNGLVGLKEENNNNLAIDQEIECPSCRDIMTLYSDFDRLRYVCEECTFLLALN
jgi:hypothetical protein